MLRRRFVAKRVLIPIRHLEAVAAQSGERFYDCLPRERFAPGEAKSTCRDAGDTKSVGDEPLESRGRNRVGVEKEEILTGCARCGDFHLAGPTGRAGDHGDAGIIGEGGRDGRVASVGDEDLVRVFGEELGNEVGERARFISRRHDHADAACSGEGL